MAVFRPRAPDTPPRILPAVAELAREPAAAFWAEACGWVPGTGHCRSPDCTAACLFQSQRAAEAGRITRWRRLRRVLFRRRHIP
ncbi:MAG TPA: hypothetical protein VME45_13750 [Stellaceae bacterium]|nr:hypothetical protein [Stellaceae bacterium]